MASPDCADHRAFLARRHTRFDWLPFVWAQFVLAYQFDYWWESFQLLKAPGITMMAFGFLLLLALTLSFSGGLVLPFNADKYPPDLADYFQQEAGGSPRFGLLQHCRHFSQQVAVEPESD